MRHVSLSTVRRLSLYLLYLEDCARRGLETVSSRALAEPGGATPAQVRKDLSNFGSFGRRGIGYSTVQLASRIRGILGLGRRYRVVLVGAGRIGSALVNYPGFDLRGFDITACYDVDPAKIGRSLGGVPIRSVDDLASDLEANPAEIAIIGTPAGAAQQTADRLVRAGVKAILNFAPTSLHVPQTVAVSNVNMALELEALSFALNRRP